jgi:hypothetical protein
MASMRTAEEKFYRARITTRDEFSPGLWKFHLEPGGEFQFVAGQFATLGVQTPQGDLPWRRNEHGLAFFDAQQLSEPELQRSGESLSSGLRLISRLCKSLSPHGAFVLQGESKAVDALRAGFNGDINYILELGDIIQEETHRVARRVACDCGRSLGGIVVVGTNREIDAFHAGRWECDAELVDERLGLAIILIGCFFRSARLGNDSISNCN